MFCEWSGGVVGGGVDGSALAGVVECIISASWCEGYISCDGRVEREGGPGAYLVEPWACTPLNCACRYEGNASK